MAILLTVMFVYYKFGVGWAVYSAVLLIASFICLYIAAEKGVDNSKPQELTLSGKVAISLLLLLVFCPGPG